MARNPPSTTDESELARPWAASDRRVPRRVVQPLQAFLHTEVAGGVLLLVAAVVALVWANSPFSSTYEELWGTELSLRLGRFALTEDLRHWVNELLMALFFFVVGLEIKRELVDGELRERRAAMLPALCAIGGMVVPALLYLLVATGSEGQAGWGIPMATDIAFAVGVLSLVGNRVPTSLKVLLLSLAIVDDLGAILVIAIFYSEGLALGWLAAAGGIVAVIVVLRRLDVRSLVPYVVLAGALWLAVFSSGVHATLAGVVLGFLTPARPFYRLEAAAQAAEPHLRDGVSETMLDVRNLAREAVSPLVRLISQLHPWSTR